MLKTTLIPLAGTALLSAVLAGCGSSPTAGSLLANAPDAVTGPPELGRVRWQRGFDGVAATAREAKKPILTLFQEVPG